MPAFVQSNTAVSSSATSLNCSFGSNVAASGFLVTAGRVGAAGRTITVTDSFGTQSVDLQQNDTGVATTGYIAHKASVAGGADTATTAISGAAASIRFAVHEYSGMGAATLGQTNSAALGNTAVGVQALSGNITTTSPNALIFGLVIDDNSGSNSSWTVTPSWNARATIVVATACVYTDDLIVASTGTYQNGPAPVSATSNIPASLVAAFVIPGAGSAPVLPMRIPNPNVGPMALRFNARKRLQGLFATQSGQAQSSFPAGLGSAAAFGAVTPVPGQVIVAIAGLGSAAAFGVVIPQQRISVVGLGSAAAFGAVIAIPGGRTIVVSGLGSAAAFGAVTVVAGNVNVPVNGRGSAAAFGAVSVSGGNTVSVASLGSAAAFGAVTPLAGPVIIVIAGLGSAAAIGAVSASTTGGGGSTFIPAVHGGKHR